MPLTSGVLRAWQGKTYALAPLERVLQDCNLALLGIKGKETEKADL